MRRLPPLIAALLLLGTSAAAAASVQQRGSIPMADGTQLAYTVVLPEEGKRFPVAMVYDGYCEGTIPMTCNDVASANALLAAGYAVLGVSVRGTGCSTGTFDALSDQEMLDGAEAVEWAARQPWSNGHLGMFGDSFPGITQVGVAGLRPPHLDAISPFQVTTDTYRDVAGPGGLPNTGFGAFWGLANQPAASYGYGTQAGNPDCVAERPKHLAAEPTGNIFLQGLQHFYDDEYWQRRVVGRNLDRIDVPVFSCVSWQDDEISSRGSFDVSTGLDPGRTWTIAANGYHAMCDRGTPRIVERLVAFFDRFVKGEPNGFERTPRFELWHEAHKDEAGDNVPSWVTTFPTHEAIPVEPLKLFFAPDGTLSLTPPAAGAPPATYAYPGPALGTENGVVFGQNGLLWKAPPAPGASLSYTTPALAQDTELFGSGSADLWLSSSVAPDVDVQITLTEVRPDGQEVYVNRGWLRASHRKLDPARSTPLAPFHTHQEADAEPLVPGEPALMRVQLWPFDHVFRRGSSLRLWIDAPTGATGGWSFLFNAAPTIARVFADAEHPSALVLGHLRGGQAEEPYPACGTLLNQPCRDNPAPVPAGALEVR
jgi:putative CocE/NonD family hydrolase